MFVFRFLLSSSGYFFVPNYLSFVVFPYLNVFFAPSSSSPSLPPSRPLSLPPCLPPSLPLALTRCLFFSVLLYCFFLLLFFRDFFFSFFFFFFSAQPLRLEIKKKLSSRSDRVKCVDIHPTEPWVLSALYNGHVFIWDFEVSLLRVDLNEDCFLGLFQYFHKISVVLVFFQQEHTETSGKY